MRFLRRWFTHSSPNLEHFVRPANVISKEAETENEFACLLEEYSSLRAEILVRLEAQNDLQNLTIILIGAALPVGVNLVRQGHYLPLLLLPLLFLGLAWLVLIQETYIDAIVVYFNGVLGPRMDVFLQDKLSTKGGIWEWEIFQYTTFYDKLWIRILFAPLGLLKYALPVSAAVISAATYFRFSGKDFEVATIDGLLFGVDLVVLILLGAAIPLLKQPRLKVPQKRRQDIAGRFQDVMEQ